MEFTSCSILCSIDLCIYLCISEFFYIFIETLPNVSFMPHSRFPFWTREKTHKLHARQNTSSCGICADVTVVLEVRHSIVLCVILKVLHKGPPPWPRCIWYTSWRSTQLSFACHATQAITRHRLRLWKDTKYMLAEVTLKPLSWWYSIIKGHFTDMSYPKHHRRAITWVRSPSANLPISSRRQQRSITFW